MDGAVSGLTAQLDWLAHIAKAELSSEEYDEIVANIGAAMGALYAISSKLYDCFPDIVPAELRPS
jgi:hypothetical protein